TVLKDSFIKPPLTAMTQALYILHHQDAGLIDVESPLPAGRFTRYPFSHQTATVRGRGRANPELSNIFIIATRHGIKQINK
ncbi:MAG: hypothetical protein KAH21_06265, partial [Spirochaetaceae bacterium]|nr:hypothetical protein [Spirochaetaceae bacterium]